MTTLSRARPAPHPNHADASPACRGADPEIFFPLGGIGADHARRICQGCPLRQACLDHALAYDLHGIWGATTRTERNRIRQQLGIQPHPILHHRDQAEPFTPPTREPRRPEVATPAPAHPPAAVEVRHAEPTASPVAEQPRRFEYDPRRPVLTPSRAAKTAPPAPTPVVEPPPPVRSEPAEPVKFCPRCRTDRALTDYYPNRGNPDGLAVWCKPCFTEIAQRQAVQR